VKVFCTSSDCEYSAYSSGLLTEIMHPCLLYLQPAAASSCLRPARPWPPLRSPLQLRVPPPVAHVPSAPSLTRYALPPHSTSPPPQHQPPSPARITGFALSSQVRALPTVVAVAAFGLSQQQPAPTASHASQVRALLPPLPLPRSSRERYRRCLWFVPRVHRPGTFYVATAGVPVAAITPQQSSHQPLPSAALPGTCTPHYYYRPSSLSPPPRVRNFAPFFIYPPPPSGNCGLPSK
jgi:hypothetical protein